MFDPLVQTQLPEHILVGGRFQGFAECVARTGTAVILVSLIGENGIYFAEPAAWAAAAVTLVSTYYYRQNRLDALART